MSTDARRNPAINLTKKELLRDQDECLILTPPQGEKDWSLPQEALRFLDRAFPENGYRRSLPEVSPQYLNELQSLIRKEETSCLYVIPPFVTLRHLPEDVEEALTGRFGAAKNADLSGITLVAILDALSRDARVAFTLPTNFFTLRSTESLRRESLEKGHPEVIIKARSHPYGEVVDSSFQTETIIYANQGLSRISVCRL